MPSMPLQLVFLISSTTAAVLLPPQYFNILARPLFTSFTNSVILSFSSWVRQRPHQLLQGCKGSLHHCQFELYQSLERLIIYRTIGLKRSNEGNTKAPKYILCHNLNKQNRWQKYTIISILQNKIALFLSRLYHF